MAKILVVEDNATVRSLAVALLQQAGHTCATAEDGREALERVVEADVPYDLILSDADMPHCSGPELLDALLRRERGPVRFLLMSGTYQEDEIDLAPAQPEDRVAFIPKPFRGAELCATIERMLEGSTLQSDCA